VRERLWCRVITTKYGDLQSEHAFSLFQKRSLWWRDLGKAMGWGNGEGN